MESLVDDLVQLGESRSLLPLLCVLCLNCSIEAFKAFASPYLYGKRASSPNRYLRRQARLEIYQSFFNDNEETNRSASSPKKKRTAERHSYLKLAQLLCSHSERWGEFLADEVLSIVLLVEQHVSGFIKWDDIDNFSSYLDEELHKDPTRPELIMQNLFLALVSKVYENLSLDTVPVDVKSRVRDLLKTIRRKTKVQPLELLLSNANDDCWSDASLGNEACIKTIEALISMACGMGSRGASMRGEGSCMDERTSTPQQSRLRVEELNISTQTPLSLEHQPIQSPLNSPAEAKTVLRNSLKSLEQRARELSQHLDTADDIIAEDQALWEQIRGLGEDLGQALTVEQYVVQQKQQQQHQSEESSDIHGLPKPHQDASASMVAPPMPPVDDDGRSTTNSTMSTSNSAPRRLFPGSGGRIRSIGPSTLTYEGLMSMQSQSTGKPLRSPTKSDQLRQKFQDQYSHIKEIYDVRVTPKRSANLSIIKSPGQRQQSGNLNYYDTKYMRWQASQKRHNPHNDRILEVDDYRDLKYYREVYTMFHHSR